MSTEPRPNIPFPIPEAVIEALPSEIRALQKKRSGLIASFGFAIAGLLRTLCTQRNMKIHWVSGLAVMLVGMALDLDIAARASLLFCVFLVLTMETLNTAFEAFVDLHIREFAPAAMVAKDAAAGAVFVVAIAAVAVLGDVLLHRWDLVENSAPAVLRTVLAGVPLLAMVSYILASNGAAWVRGALGIVALGSTTFLAFHSKDHVFSGLAFVFVLVALYTRAKEASLRS